MDDPEYELEEDELVEDELAEDEELAAWDISILTTFVPSVVFTLK